MYEKNGIVYPRCTDIISDCTNKSGGLVQWAANQAVEWIREKCRYQWRTTTTQGIQCLCSDEHLEQARFAYKYTSKIARDVGSDVHNAIEKHLKGESYTLVSTQAESAFNAFLEWELEVDLDPIHLEQPVWGDRWAGTLDFYGWYKNKLYVIDWKTSKAFYPEMRYQVAAYQYATTEKAYREQGDMGMVPGGCGVLMLDKETGMPTFKDTSKTYEKDLETFNKMVELYFLRHPRIAKRFEKGE